MLILIKTEAFGSKLSLTGSKNSNFSNCINATEISVIYLFIVQMFTEIESFLRLVTKLDLAIVIVFLGMPFLTGFN